MPDGSKVRVGFVGVGKMGQCAHLRNYATIPECEVAAIAEVRPETARRVAEHYGVLRVYASHEEMLANEELDAIVASHPFWRHGVVLPEVIRAGKPMFIEKPLASTIESGEKILQACQDSGAWIMVGYHKRSDPATMFAKAEIDRLKESGELGCMRYVRVVMPAGEWTANGFLGLIDGGDPLPKLPGDPPAPDMDEQTFNRYCGFVNYYIHQVNLVRHLLGESYRVTYADPSGVLLVGQSESGVACAIEMSPYETTVDWQESAMVCFEKGYVKIDLPAPMVRNRAGRVEILRDPGGGATPEATTPHLPSVHAMRQQALNFLAAVRGQRAPMCGAPEALADLKLAREYIRLLKGV